MPIIDDSKPEFYRDVLVKQAKGCTDKELMDWLNLHKGCDQTAINYIREIVYRELGQRAATEYLYQELA